MGTLAVNGAEDEMRLPICAAASKPRRIRSLRASLMMRRSNESAGSLPLKTLADETRITGSPTYCEATKATSGSQCAIGASVG